MAPLAELSVNRPGKTKQVSLNGTSIASGKRQTPSSLQENNTSTLPTASAIQSMLKNTTELGDAGQFAAKSTKIPRYKTSTAARTQPQQDRQRRPLYPEYAEGNHITQRRYHPNHNDPREYSLRHNNSSRTNGGHSLISDSQDQRSDSVTQSSNNSRRISVHPSLLNIRPYGRVGPRPRSPYAYPSRLRRPGYRPSSPGYSEINVSDSAVYASVHRAYSTRTESPTSAMRKGAQAWDHGFHRSDPLLQHYPAFALSRRHDRHRSPPFLRRAALPSSLLASHRSSFIGKPRAPKAPDSGSSAERAGSSAPLFYDYSEAFEEESFRHTAQRSSMFESRHIPQSDGSSEGYQADVTNTSSTGTKCSSSSTESKAISPKRTGVNGKRPSPLRFVSRILKQQSAEHDKAVDIDSGSSASSDIILNPSDDVTLTKDLAKTEIHSKKACEVLAAEANMADPFNGSSAAQNDLQRPPSAYDPAPKVIKTAAVTMRLSSSSSGSQYSSSAHSRPDKAYDPSTIQVPEMVYERQPKALSVSFNRLEMIRHGSEDGEPQQRAASLDTRGRPERFQIFSPVPERSMSSRDSRDRFSRILSIGDDFCQRDLFANTLPNKKAPMTIQQYLRDRKAPVHKAKASPIKDLPPLPDGRPFLSSKGKEKEIEEPLGDCDATEQFTSPRQTPNEDNETHSISGLERVAALNDFGRPGIPPRYSSISRNSLFDMPESSRSVRVSTVSQKHDNEEQSRRFAMTPQNSSLFQTMKELPPLPNELVTSMPSVQEPSSRELPCLLTPLIAEKQLGTPSGGLKGSSKAQSPQQQQPTSSTDARVEQQTPPRTIVIGYEPEQGLNASPASVRPWNLDASYPWAGTPPKLEVSLPQPIQESTPQPERAPRFRFNVHRSSVLRSSRKLLKPRPANIKGFPAQDTGRQMTPVHARFMEGLDHTKGVPPSLALVPPSPGLQIEAQSFFSDDSSQRRRKGSLRRRFSQMKGAIRAGSSDDIRAPERVNASPALGFSRASKGSSKQSSTAPDDNTPKMTTKWTMFRKIKSWFHRREENIKKWRLKLSPENHSTRQFGTRLPSGM
ncbi:MAG: hypothetical protein LQ343_006386 [Gyalolechia ehrenbergii]|nr:MAG: hypothetical protein LQ343_006386 [Gyalolechia ehrenbergii]